MKKILTALAAASVVFAPTMAVAANSSPASSLSVARASASMDDESELGGGNILGYVFLAAFLAAAVYAVLEISDDDDDGDDYAVSP